MSFVLDQTPSLDRIDLQSLTQTDVPSLGPFRTFQVPVAHIAELTGLNCSDLVAADRKPTLRSIAVGGRSEWDERHTLTDASI